MCSYLENAFPVLLRLRTCDLSPIPSNLFFSFLRLLDELAVLTSSTGSVRSSTTPPLLISRFPLPRCSSSRCYVVVLMFLVVAELGVDTPQLRLYLLISHLRNPLCLQRPVASQRTVPSHYSGRRFRLPHPVPVLHYFPTLQQSNAFCPLTSLPHFQLGAHRRSPPVYGPPPPRTLHQNSDSYFHLPQCRRMIQWARL